MGAWEAEGAVHRASLGGRGAWVATPRLGTVDAGLHARPGAGDGQPSSKEEALESIEVVLGHQQTGPSPAPEASSSDLAADRR